MDEFQELVNKYKKLEMSTELAFQTVNNLEMNVLKDFIVEKGIATYEELPKIIHERLSKKVDEDIKNLRRKTR